MGLRMLLYIPLLSSILGLFHLGRIGFLWFRNEILVNVLIFSGAVYALYTDSIPATAGVLVLFCLSAILPLFLRRYIGRKMADPSSFKQMWALKLLLLFAYGSHSQASVLMWKGLIAGSLGDKSGIDSTFEQIDAMNPPDHIRSMALIEHLRALALVRSWEKIVSLCSESQVPSPAGLKSQFHLWYGQGLIATGQISGGLEETFEGFVIAPSFEAASFVEFSILSASALSGQLDRTIDALKTTALLSGELAPVFAWYWRGRCHYVRGERDEALHCLMMAQENATATNTYWNLAISEWLDKCETGELLPEQENSPEFLKNFNELIGKMKLSMASLLSHSPHFYEKKATNWLIGFLSIIFVAECWFGAVTNMDMLLSFGAFMPALVIDGDYYRLVTAVFLHGSLLHLFFNVLGLKLFGPFVEDRLGFFSYIAFFVLTGVIGNLCGLWPVSFMVAVGASGGVMGILGASMVFLVFDSRSALDPERNKRIKDLVFLLGANLVIGSIESSVFNGAHIGGLISGAVLAFLVCYKSFSPFKDKVLSFYKLAGLFLIVTGLLGMFFQRGSLSSHGHFTTYPVKDTGYEVKVPSHWLVEGEEKNVLRAYGFDGTRVLFFAVQPLLSVDKEDAPFSLLHYVAYACFEGQKNTAGVVMSASEPQLKTIQGKEIAFWEYESNNVRWYDQVEIVGLRQGALSLMGRIVTPWSVKGPQLKLFSQMSISAPDVTKEIK